MNRSDFIKALGIGATGLIIPSNSFLHKKSVKIYDNYIKGLTYYKFTKLRNGIKEGDMLILCREAENKYDSFAVSVMYNTHKLGYIAAYENIILANMLDAGVNLMAYVSHINTDDINIYTGLAIEVYAELIIPTQKLIDSLLAENRADDAPDIYRKGF